MISLKCKSCGGELEITEESTVCECEYCGLKQTVPVLDDEKKIKLFERANRLRLNCEFDKAAGIYENIVEEFSEEAEGYWGLILCKYGIEYVDDPAGDKVPTCHRSSFDSVMEDKDLELALEYADLAAKRVYREQAKQLEEIRKGIIEVVGKEEPYDIFICYKETDENGDRTIDSVMAQDIYDALTEKGYRVFFSRISLEDKLGVEYEPFIFAALNSAKIMLAVGTDYEYYVAVWVKNEWSRFLKLMAKDKSKHLIPCYKNLDAYDIPKEFAHLQAQDMGKVGAVQDLIRGIEKLIGNRQDDANVSVKETSVVVSNNNNSKADALIKRGFMALEDGEFETADKFFEEALNENPECPDAYMGKIYAFLKINSKEHFAEYISNAYRNMPIEEQEIGVDYDVFDIVRNEFKYNKELDEEYLISIADTFYNAKILPNPYIADIDAKSFEAVLAWEGENISKLYKRFQKYANDEAVAKHDVLEMVRGLLAEDVKEEIEKQHTWSKENLINILHKANVQLDEIVPNENAKAEKEYRERLAQWEKNKEEKESEWKNECEELKREWSKKCEIEIKNWEQNCKLLDTEYAQMCEELTVDFNLRKNRFAEEMEKYEQQIQKYEDNIVQINNEIRELDYEIGQTKGIFKIVKKKELERKKEDLVSRRERIKMPEKPLPFTGGDENGNLIIPPKKDYPIKPVLNAEPELPEMPYIEPKPRLEDVIGVDIDDYLRNYLRECGFRIKEGRVNRFEKISFGHYNYVGNNKRSLTWYVLKKIGNSALLITEKAIDCVKYFEEYEGITWERCTLRKWLNSNFIKAAFTEKERQRIKETKVINKDNEESYAEGGNDTLDKVFCLSIDEANELFNDDEERIAKATPYARKKGANCVTADLYDRDWYDSDEEYEKVIESVTGDCWWWLRSPGSDSEYATCVDYDGSVHNNGVDVNNEVAVRPALWIDISNL